MNNQIIHIIKTHVERSNDPNFRLLRTIRGRGGKPTIYIYENYRSLSQSYVGDVAYTINSNNINSLIDELSSMHFGGLKKSTRRRKHKKSRKSHKKSKKYRR
jgi:hypothetical protein